MPIKGFETRQRIPRLGKIRLGVKKRNANGAEYPVKTDYFVCKDAPDIAAIYGETPRSLEVEFYSDDIDEIFPCWMKQYGTGGALRCLGDGERAIIRYTRPSQTGGAAPMELVRDGLICNEQFRQEYGADVYRCPCQDGDEEWHQAHGGKRAPCQPTGRLLFGLRKAPQLGYYELVCHQRAIVGVLSVLRLTLNAFGQLRYIPFELYLVPERLTVGGSAQTVYTPTLRIEPEWGARALTARRELALAEATGEGARGLAPAAAAPQLGAHVDAEDLEPDGDDTVVDPDTGEITSAPETPESQHFPCPQTADWEAFFAEDGMQLGYPDKASMVEVLREHIGDGKAVRSEGMLAAHKVLVEFRPQAV